MAIVSGTTMDTNAMHRMVKHLFKNLIPIDTFWENVYRTDMSMRLISGTYILKFTFFNDETMKIEFSRKDIQDETVIVPVCDDFEAWKAEALMRCEAGEDVYERPGKLSSLNSTTMDGLSRLSQTRLNQLQSQKQATRSGQRRLLGGLGSLFDFSGY